MVTQAILEKLDDVLKNARLFRTELNANVRISNRLKRQCISILRMCIPPAEFSAFTATAVLQDHDYVELKQILQEKGQWNEELQELERQSQRCVFRTRI